MVEMLKILHFADAHIDMANYGRHDPESGLPLRVLDYLKSLDQIIDTAINERVDLVLFAGDTYKDRNPAPTYQREWGLRMMRLSRAGIPALLLVGNHDLSPAHGRAHALDAFATLEVPNVHVLDKPQFAAWLTKEFERMDSSWVAPGELFMPLSPREMEILHLITKGMSNKEIARQLGISHQTVKNHMTSILRKLSVNDRTQAAVYALRRGWVRLQDTTEL